MNVHRLLVVGVAALAAAGIGPVLASTRPESPVRMVITALPANGNLPVQSLTPSNLTVLQGNNPAEIVSLERFAGDQSGVQLYILLDDSSHSSSLTLHFSELRPFLKNLPADTQVAVGYMRNGTAILAQAFTLDHQAAAKSLRAPLAVPGLNASPYFALSDLVKHWPSAQPAPRKVVLMLTDGVDRYFGTSMMDDPYTDSAIRDALSHGVAVYSIYLRGSGVYGRGAWTKDFAQSRLQQVAEQTGGYAYFQDFSDPVTIAPFLSDFQNRLANQYVITVAGLHGHGVLEVKVRSELPSVKVTGPVRVYLP